MMYKKVKEKSDKLLKLIIGFISIFFSVYSYAQQTNNIISIKHISLPEGVAGKQVFCGMQDSRGFIWIGTAQGLQRYDGKKFILFTKEKDGLQDNVVVNIVEDEKERLWIMYANISDRSFAIAGKIDILDLKTNSIKPFSGNSYLKKMPFDYQKICTIYSNEKKQLLFLLTNDKNELLTKKCDLYFYNNRQGFKNLHTNIKYAGYNNTAICFRGDSILYNNDKVSCIRNVKVDKPIILNNKTGNFTNYTPVCITSQGSAITLGYNFPSTPQGVFLKHNKTGNTTTSFNITDTKKLQNIKGHNYAYPIYNSQLGTSICINSNMGIQLYDGNDFIKILDDNFINKELSVQIYNYFTTTLGSHFICTSDGLYQINIVHNYFEHVMSSDVVKGKEATLFQTRNIFEDSTNNILLNTWGGFFSCTKKNNGYEYNRIMKNMQIPYTDGSVFDGTYMWVNTGGHKQINKYKLKDNFTDKLTKKFIIGKNLWTGIKTHSGFTLLATLDKLYKINGDDFSEIIFNDSTWKGTNWIQQFYYTKDNTLWAVGNNGIFIINDSNKITARYAKDEKEKKHQLPVSDIHAMCETVDGSIWLATNGAGLIKWNRTKNNFKQYTLQNGLSSNILYAVLQDQKGYLWISSDNGLTRFDPNTEAVKVYTKSEGLTNNEFNRCAFLKARDGKMFFGGLDGVNAFYPKRFWGDTARLNAELQVISFNQFDGKANKLIDRTIELLSENKITINPDDKFFTLEFQLLDFKQGAQHYAYKINGVDKDWNYINENSIRISGLPYGNFTLQIKGQNAEGVWSTKQLAINLQNIAPISSTWWFRLGILLISLATLFFLFWRRNKQLLATKNVLEKTVHERTSELNTSLQQKEVLLKEIHHRVKNNLTVISSLLELQSQSLTDQDAKTAFLEGQNRVKSMAMIHQRLYQNENFEAIEFKEFTQQLYHEINAVFNKDKHTVIFKNLMPEILIDIDTAIPIGLIMNELFTNSFKYAFENTVRREITINLFKSEKKGEMILSYSDNGPGLPEGFDFLKAKSLGIKLIRMLAKQLSGKASYLKNENYANFIITFFDSETRNEI